MAAQGREGECRCLAESTPLNCPAVPAIGWKVCHDCDGVSVECNWLRPFGLKHKLETLAEQAAYHIVVDAKAHMPEG